MLVLFTAASIGEILGTRDDDSRTGAVAIIAVCCAGTLLRRFLPRAVTAVTGIGALLLTALGCEPTALVLAPVMLALFGLSIRTDRRTTVTVAFALMAGLSVATRIPRYRPEPVSVAETLITACLLVPVALGTAVRLRRS